jgi:zinc protease
MRSGVCPGPLLAAPLPGGRDWPALTVVRKTLANGLRVILAENRTVPLVFLSWTSQAGFEADPPGLEGLASLTSLLLREETAHRSGGALTQELEDLGADLVAGADWGHAFLNLDLLSCDLAAGVDLLLDMARAPRFRAAAVARLQRRRLAELERRRRDPRAMANDEFARALFGETLYGRSPLGTPATVQRIDAADVAAFHDACYQPATSYVVMAGSFDSESATELLGSFELRAALRPDPVWPRLFAPAVEPPGEVRLVDAPHATQTEVRVGHAGVARDSEDLPALEVLNAILGGGPASRLAGSVRQHEGLTYHVRSRFAARRLGGTFVVATSVAHEAAGAALAGIRREMERLRDELVPAVDVEEAKRRLFGADARRFQDLIGTGATLGPAALHDDPVCHLERRRQASETVEPDALRQLARRHLHPERLIAVIVGPANVLQSQFSSDGPHTCQPVPLESTS